MAQLPIPSFINKYFWDVDVAKVNIQTNKKYIVERLLEYGNENALQWVDSTYAADDIKKIIRTSRSLSRKSGFFYSLYYHINPIDILCLHEDFRHKHRKIWRH